MPHNIEIDVFKGPFDLLLHLVRVNEMDIYDIPLAKITDQYLEAVKQIESVDLTRAGDFLVMAATLINLKSRTLMPPMSGEEEEESEEEVDEEYENIRSAQDLMERLIEYRRFKEVASKLSEREEEQTRLFYRNSVLPTLTRDDREDGELHEDINLLLSAFAQVLDFTERRPTHRVLEEEFSVEEKIETIKRQLMREKRIKVNDLFAKCLNKSEVITVFLALLELCKMKLSRVRQVGNYEDIEIVLASEPEDDED